MSRKLTVPFSHQSTPDGTRQEGGQESRVFGRDLKKKVAIARKDVAAGRLIDGEKAMAKIIERAGRQI